MDKGRKVRLAFTVVAAVFTVLFAGLLWFDLRDLPNKQRFNATYEQLRSEVQRELPAGSSRLEVESFLSRRSIATQYLPQRNELFGTSQETYSGVISHCRVQLAFRFGENSRLRESKVYKSCAYL